MLKDTKSLGNNKAPACESRGFVHKKRGVHFDTPPFCLTCKKQEAPDNVFFHLSRTCKLMRTYAKSCAPIHHFLFLFR